jgi:uncharacterized membrane protein
VDPVLLVAVLWAAFLGTHIGLAAAPVRSRLVARLGERGFLWTYVAIASALFAAVVVGYASVAGEGPRGLGLGDDPWARGALAAVIALGVVLMVGAFAPRAYWDSPIVVLGTGVRAPYGLERITRHPFFAGTALLAAAHMLLAARATGAVFFAGFFVLATVGPAHQARKLRALRGPAYDEFLAKTSAVPFLAILRGRQQLVLAELPWATLSLAAIAALALRTHHPGILAWHGAPVIAVAVGSSVTIGIVQSRRRR